MARLVAPEALCNTGYVESEAFDCQQYAVEWAWIASELDAGRVVFNTGLLPACLLAAAQFDPAACWGATPTRAAALAAVDAACSPVLAGAVVDGSMCLGDFDCVPDDYCTGYGGCRGTCEDRGYPGDICAPGECLAGLICSGGDSLPDGGSAPYTCKTPSPTPLDPGADCSSGAPCLTGYACLGNTCRPVGTLGAGAACGTVPSAIDSSDCSGRQSCVGLIVDVAGGVTQRGTCAAPQGIGGPCAPPVDGGSKVISGCYGGLFCDPGSKKCIGPPGEGRPCINGVCAESLFCASGGICRAPPTLGEACIDRTCATGLLCNPITNSCVTPPELGQPCVLSTCDSGLVCDDANNCVLLPKIGSACVSGRCEALGWCSGAYCVAKLPDGSGCAYGIQCVSNYCDSQTNLCGPAFTCP